MLEHMIEEKVAEAARRLNVAIDLAYQADLSRLQEEIKELIARYGEREGRLIATSRTTPGDYWHDQIWKALQLKSAGGRWKRISSVLEKWNATHGDHAVKAP